MGNDAKTKADEIKEFMIFRLSRRVDFSSRKANIFLTSWLVYSVVNTFDPLELSFLSTSNKTLSSN